jgi:hypothetical protein
MPIESKLFWLNAKRQGDQLWQMQHGQPQFLPNHFFDFRLA